MATDHTFLKFAQLAYETPASDDDALMKAQLIDSQISKAFFADADHDTQYYTFVKDNGDLIFAFRGSSSTQDFFVDALFFKTRMTETNAWVHTGFYKQFNAIKFSVMSSIITRCRKMKDDESIRVTFVGHSLGGALATLCALTAKLSLKSKVVVDCVTFGSPRVGNGAFATLFNELVDMSKRFVNGSDAVTRNPRFYYSHVKGEQTIGDKGAWFSNIQDHYLDSYSKSLK